MERQDLAALVETTQMSLRDRAEQLQRRLEEVMRLAAHPPVDTITATDLNASAALSLAGGQLALHADLLLLVDGIARYVLELPDSTDT